jgi:hypothetical protein
MTGRDRVHRRQKVNNLHSECQTAENRGLDAAAGLNALIPAKEAPFLPVDPTTSDLRSDDRYADYTLTVDPSVPGVAFASPNGKLTVW